MKLASIVFAATLAATAAFAAPGPPPGGGAGHGAGGGCPMAAMGGGHGGRGGPGAMAAIMAPVSAVLMHRTMLNLTDEQASRLATLHAENQKAVARRVADAYVAHIDLMQALTRPEPERRAVEAAARTLGQQVTEFILTQSRAYLDALQVLTPAQRQQLQRMVSLHTAGGCPGCPGMMRGMMGGMMGGAMGGQAGGTATPPPTAPAEGGQ